MEEYNLSDRNRDDDQNKEKDKAIEDSLFDNLVNDVSQNVHIEAEQNVRRNCFLLLCTLIK